MCALINKVFAHIVMVGIYSVCIFQNNTYHIVYIQWKKRFKQLASAA